ARPAEVVGDRLQERRHAERQRRVRADGEHADGECEPRAPRLAEEAGRRWRGRNGALRLRGQGRPVYVRDRSHANGTTQMRVCTARGRLVISPGSGHMREIVSGVSTWSRLSEPHGYDFNGYLVHDASGNLCIDPVALEPDDAAEITRRGVRHILLTNRNHVRAANDVRRATGARTAIHPDDAAYARSQGAEIDDELHAGMRFGPLVVVAVPGKSPGEVALH